MTSIITTGCSFTHDPDSWANILQDKISNDHNVYNCAAGGVGQEYIVRSALLKLQQTQGSKICIAQFSGFWRLEFNVYKDENMLFDKVITESPDWEHSRTWYNGELTEDNFFILKTTDIGHQWWANRPTIKKTLDSIDQTIGPDQRLCWTYENILKLQLYCKQNNIPLFCFWGWGDCRPTWNDEMLDNPVNANDYPLASKVYNLVDWNNFWFHTDKGGMADWMVEHGHTGKLEEDHTNNPPKGYHEQKGKKFMIGHPTLTAHDDFCNQVIVPWVNNVLQ